MHANKFISHVSWVYFLDFSSSFAYRYVFSETYILFFKYFLF